MYRNSRIDNRERSEAVPAPSQCPGCGSGNIQTTNKVVTDATYWRCQSCGEIWNVGRRQPTNRNRWR
jgi:transposase-like protein